MVNQYIGPVHMEPLLEAAHAMTGWGNHPSWPAIINYLGKVGINETYIQENETYIRECLDQYSLHSVGNIHNADTGSTPRHSPLLPLQQWPATPPDSGRILNSYKNHDDSRSAASSPHSNGQRFTQLKSFSEIDKTELSKSLPYKKILLRPAPLPKAGGDSLKMRPTRIWSYKQNDWHPATTTEGFTSCNFVRRELIEATGLLVNELDKSNQALSAKRDPYPPEGLTVIALQPEGCIQTLIEQFLVTSDKDAPDLSIGPDLSAKFEHFRNVIRSHQEMIEHHRYGGGLEFVPGNPEPGPFIRPRNRTNNSARPDEEPTIRYPYTDIDQQGSEIPGRLAGVDEKSPLITRRRLPASSELHNSSDTNNHPLSGTIACPRTTDAQVQVNQAGPMTTAPVASGHEPSNGVTLRLTMRNLLGCGAGMIFLTMGTSLWSAYLVRRWNI